MNYKYGGLLTNLSRWLLLIATGGTVIMFSCLSSAFLKPANILDIIRSAAIIGILGIGMTINQAAGEFDFTIASLATLAAVCMAYTQKEIINNFWIAVFVTFSVCGIVAAVKIACVLYIKMPGWITTLGFSTLLSGISKYLTGGGNYFSTNWLPFFRWWGQGFLFGVIPMPAVILIVVTILAFIFLEKTKWGRYMYAVGINPVAAEYVGINIRRSKALSYVFTSMCSCVAGIIIVAQLGSASAQIADGNMLLAISTSMLGATFLRPGVYNIAGSFVGAILLSVISNGLTMISASYHMKDIIQGLVLVVSIMIVALINMKNKSNS
jgi:ribose/xylose/arabinose/galactoside ABC-type transport system permease subunit